MPPCMARLRSPAQPRICQQGCKAQSRRLLGTGGVVSRGHIPARLQVEHRCVDHAPHVPVLHDEALRVLRAQPSRRALHMPGCVFQHRHTIGRGCKSMKGSKELRHCWWTRSCR